MSIPSAPHHPGLLVSDRDREDQVDLLRRHAGEGRLTVDELDARSERAYAARTQQELAAVLTDLPASSEAVRQPEHREPAGRLRAADLAPYVAVNVLLIAIWALTGGGYFWPIWPLLGWGIGIVAHIAHAGPGRPARGRGGCGRPRTRAPIA